MLHTTLHQSLHVHHTLVIVFSDSFAVAKSDNDCVICCCKINIRNSSGSICRVNDRFSFCTIVNGNTSLDSCYIGSIQCQRYIVEVALKKLNSPFHKLWSIILCRSDVYIKIGSACIQLLFCTFQDRLRISLCKCFVYSRCCGGKSLTNGNKFCHSFVLLFNSSDTCPKGNVLTEQVLR